MSTRLLVIGLDAAEATLIEDWTARGLLPTCARLAATGATGVLESCLETLPGAVWPELTTGRSCGKVGHFFHPDQLHTGEARLRPVTVHDIDAEQYYWSVASRAGLRIAAIDQVHTTTCAGLGGVQLTGWGLHDRNLVRTSDPPEFLDRVRARYGKYPIWACDDYPDSRRGQERLLRDLLRCIEVKSSLLLDLLSAESWDLFTCVLTETHCAGHQYWHHFDTAHPMHDPRAPDALKNAIRTVYSRTDAVLGDLIAAAGREATVLLYTSHGMGPLVGGYLLLPEVLVRLGMSSDEGRAGRSLLRDFQGRVRDRIPKRWVPAVQKLGRNPLLRWIQEPVGGLVYPLQSPKTRAAALPNNRVGAIRLNLCGREPLGCVEPGREADALLDELREELLALQQPESGEPIVKRVATAREAFGVDHHPDIPDLLVVFRNDLGELSGCRSARVGTVRVPVRNARIPRSGDHTARSRLWAMGSGIPPGSRLRTGHSLDLAPTVLRHLGVPLPPWLDGDPIDLGGGS